jgi:hypothetical protein
MNQFIYEVGRGTWEVGTPTSDGGYRRLKWVFGGP